MKQRELKVQYVVQRFIHDIVKLPPAATSCQLSGSWQPQTWSVKREGTSARVPHRT